MRFTCSWLNHLPMQQMYGMYVKVFLFYLSNGSDKRGLLRFVSPDENHEKPSGMQNKSTASIIPRHSNYLFMY